MGVFGMISRRTLLTAISLSPLMGVKAGDDVGIGPAMKAAGGVPMGQSSTEGWSDLYLGGAIIHWSDGSLTFTSGSTKLYEIPDADDWIILDGPAW